MCLSKWRWRRDGRRIWSCSISKHYIGLVSSCICTIMVCVCVCAMTREEAARMWRMREAEWESEAVARDRLMAEVR